MGNYDYLIVNNDNIVIQMSEYENILYTYFSKQKFGILVVNDSSQEAQSAVMTTITHKDSFPKVFCCNSDYELASMKKQLREVVDCYVADIDMLAKLNKLSEEGETVNV